MSPSDFIFTFFQGYSSHLTPRGHLGDKLYRPGVDTPGLAYEKSSVKDSWPRGIMCLYRVSEGERGPGYLHKLLYNSLVI